MSKQDIIREGLFKVLFPHSNADHYTGDETVQKVLRYLHSEGVVLKVERKLPINIFDGLGAASSEIFWKGQQSMLKWHNDSLEPLIEEK